MIAFLLTFLVACSSTSTVKIDESKQPAAPEEQAAASEPTTGGAPVTTVEGKVAISCDDLYLNDPSSPGRVTVEYSDGTSEALYDQCPGQGAFLTEYVCEGKVAKSKNVVCKGACLSVNVKDQKSCPGCKVGFCQ